MNPFRSAAVSFAVAVALGLVASATKAQQAVSPAPVASAATAPSVDVGAEPIRVDYVAYTGCPGASGFVDQVLARTPRARRAEPSELARTLIVSIIPSDAGSHGVLTVHSMSGEEATRDLTAATCNDVVAALALVAALVIDPTASTAPLPPIETPPPAPTVPEPIIAPTTNPVADRGRVSEHPPPATSAVVLGAGGGAEVAANLAPGAVVMPRLFVDVAWERATILSPSFRLSGARATWTANGTLGSADFVWITGRLEGCPIAWRPANRLALRPCVGGDVGSLQGSGQNQFGLHNVQEGSALWLAALALVRLHYWFLPSVGVELQGGVTIPLRSDRFVFANASGPDENLYEVPNVTFFGGVSLVIGTTAK